MSFGFSAHSLFLFPTTSRSIAQLVEGTIPFLRDTVSTVIERIYEAFAETLPYTSNFLFCSIAEDYIPRQILPIIHIADGIVRKDTSPVNLLICCGQIANLAKILYCDGTHLPAPCHVVANALWFSACAYKGYQTAGIATHRFSNAWRSSEMSITKKILHCADSVMLFSAGTYTVASTAFNVMQFVEGFQVFLNIDKNQQEYALRYNAISLLGGPKNCLAVHMDSFHFEVSTEQGSRPSYVNELYKNCHFRGYDVNDSESFCNALTDAATFFPHRIDFLSLFSHATSRSMSLGKNYQFTGNPVELACMDAYLARNAQVILAGCNTANPENHRTSQLELSLLTKNYPHLAHELQAVFRDTSKYKHLCELVSQSLPGKLVTGFASELYPAYMYAFFAEGKLHIRSYDEGKSINSVNVKSHPRSAVP